jgi:hypothetical protein
MRLEPVSDFTNRVFEELGYQDKKAEVKKESIKAEAPKEPISFADELFNLNKGA